MLKMAKGTQKFGINPILFPLLILLLGFLACSAGGTGTPLQDFPNEAQVEASSFDLINQDRRDQGLPELVLDDQLCTIARNHSKDMRDRGYFDHTSPDGQTIGDRLKSGGISFHFAGENIELTKNYPNPAEKANTDFLSDSTHRGILLNSTFKRVGVGVARSGNTYWITQDYINPK
jgi:uncharacterized protein YkwD